MRVQGGHWLDYDPVVLIVLLVRKGRYNVAKLVAQYGRSGNMSKWVSDLRADCPKRNAPQLHERCNLICPDLPKML